MSLARPARPASKFQRHEKVAMSHSVTGMRRRLCTAAEVHLLPSGSIIDLALHQRLPSV